MTKLRAIAGKFEKLNKAVLFSFFLLIYCTCYILLKLFVYPPAVNMVSYTNHNLDVLGLSVPAGLNFCGESIPSDNYRIREELSREFFSSAQWKSNYNMIVDKTRRWFPYIEPILKSEGIPDDFKYLAVIESHLSNAVSPAGAAGFWQLVPVTAYNYGLEVDAQVDERFHVEKATKAACQHIKDAYRVFENWTLCAAAYNRGIGGIQAALEKQLTDNYFSLLLNPETGSFVYRILAYKTLLADPAHFGIKRKKSSDYGRLPVKIIRSNSDSIDLRLLARKAGIDFSTLMNLNPWVKSDVIRNPAGKNYEFWIPGKMKKDISAYLRDLSPGRDLVAGEGHSRTGLDEISQPDTTAFIRSIIYTVRVDEPLQNLAAFLKVNEDELRQWNNLSSGMNAVKGQTLIIYLKN